MKKNHKCFEFSELALSKQSAGVYLYFTDKENEVLKGKIS